MLTLCGLLVAFVISMVATLPTFNQNISMAGSGQDLEQDFLLLTRQTRVGGRILGHIQVSRLKFLSSISRFHLISKISYMSRKEDEIIKVQPNLKPNS